MKIQHSITPNMHQQHNKPESAKNNNKSTNTNSYVSPETNVSLSDEGLLMSQTQPIQEDVSTENKGATTMKGHINITNAIVTNEDGTYTPTDVRLHYTYVQNKNFTMEKVHVKGPKHNLEGLNLEELSEKAIEAFKETEPTNGAVKMDIPFEELQPPVVEEPQEPIIEEPVDAPVEEPVEAPVETPVEQPVETPIAEPVEAPIEENPTPEDGIVLPDVEEPVLEIPIEEILEDLETPDVIDLLTVDNEEEN